MNNIKITECPRDAMQGIEEFIPTEIKKSYLNSLLKVGFDTLDFGSFVSPKAIPQLRDTAEVLAGLDLSTSKTKLLAIIANLRGGETAAAFDEITYLGFPFSISETFQKRNTNSSIEQSLATVEALQTLCVTNKKELLIYISMAFGNPYNDPWNTELAIKWISKIEQSGIKTIALADTVGIADSKDIEYMFSAVIPSFPNVEFGAHLHCTPFNWKEKVEAAWKSGCRRFDSAIKGFGGCPMAEDELVGNLATENLLSFIREKGLPDLLDYKMFRYAFIEAEKVFGMNAAT